MENFNHTLTYVRGAFGHRLYALQVRSAYGGIRMYREFSLIPQGPTQQNPWRPCWCPRQKSLIKIILNWNTNCDVMYKRSIRRGKHA